ncbi:MAG: radical SAM protein, partial [Candidatus Omnitrophica bacterium]|nr:radical SAM protein [Candidatus Omnitrophota bacterium]
MGHPPIDFNRTPFLVIWETTQACDLACIHCRAKAQPNALPGELSTQEGLGLIDAVADMGTPILVLSGGDPLKRKDLLILIRHGKSRGLRMGTIPAASPQLSREAIQSLKDAGLDQMAMSLDASGAHAHDQFRRTRGAFAKTLQAIEWAHAVGLPVQINTVIHAGNFSDLDALIHRIVFWEVFFLVPMGRGSSLKGLSALEYEEAFAKLYAVSRRCSFVLKVTEAPHFRRYYLQQQSRESVPAQANHKMAHLPAGLNRPIGPGGSIGLAPQGVNAGKGHLFISYHGEVYPSGFLPLSVGNIRAASLKVLYQDTEVFQQLRDTDLLQGRCGTCEFRAL